MILTPLHYRRYSEFYRQMGVLLRSGVPFLGALGSLAARPPSRDYRPRILRLRGRLESGATLTESLIPEEAWVPVFDRTLLEAGEKSGRLPEAFQSLADEYDQRARWLLTVMAQLAYPVFLVHVALVIFPTDLLVGMVTRGEIGLFLAAKAQLFGVVYVVAMALLWLLQPGSRGPRGGIARRLLGSIPGLGGALEELALGRLAAAMEALLSAGVNLPEAWRLGAEASGSPVIRSTVAQWLPRIESGVPPSELLRQSPRFPSTFVQLYTTGEEAGKLDGELAHLRDLYRETGSRRMGLFLMGASAFCTLAVMGWVAWQVIQFYLGYFRSVTDFL